jgi:putative transposase
MPVHRSKKCTTTNSNDSTEGQSAPGLPSQQVFQQHLRELARAAIRIVLEGVMREELDALIGVGWGESSSKRKGYRNGSYQRDLVTSSGRLADLNVPRDREGQFHTQVFERYSRDAPQIAQGLTEMFVAGTSTRHPWGKSPKPCWEWLRVPAPSVGSMAPSNSNSRPGASARGTRTGASSTWMACISACVMEIKPIPP